MKYLLLFLLVGCSFKPTQKKPKLTYKERVVKCIEKFMENFGTDIKSAYKVCKEIEKRSK